MLRESVLLHFEFTVLDGVYCEYLCLTIKWSAVPRDQLYWLF